MRRARGGGVGRALQDGAGGAAGARRAPARAPQHKRDAALAAAVAVRGRVERPGAAGRRQRAQLRHVRRRVRHLRARAPRR